MWLCKKRKNSSATLNPLSRSLFFPDKCVLDFVLAHAAGDQRPYLHVSILGKVFLGLLDSGASRTVVGGPGWQLLQTICTLRPSDQKVCTVANGQTCETIGTVLLPIRLRDRVILIDALVVPSLPHRIILGIDFWIRMEIIPNLYADEWFFCSDDKIDSMNFDGIQDFDSLAKNQRSQLNAVVDVAFSQMGNKLGCTHLVEHTIHTTSAPIKQRYYPISPAMQKIVNAELDDMLAKDVIEPSNSPWSSPIVLVKKSDNSWRFCVNYKKLNAVSTPDAYPIPYVSSILDKLRDAHFLTTLDIKSAYWQIPVAQQSRPLTAFTVPNRGLFQFKRMPFGLHSAPATWQRLIDAVLGVDLDNFIFVYLDDVIICTPTFEKHLEVLEKVLKRLLQAGLTLNRDKCIFCRSELRYLGYVVNGTGLSVDPEKVSAILNIPIPRNVSEIRRVVGLASWYRRFIPSFSTVVAPMTELTQKNRPFIWTERCDEALTTIKQHLISAPILTCPDFNRPFFVETDASDYGLGAILSQSYPEGDKVICYLSRSLTKSERKFSTTEKECLAVIFAVEKLRPYLEGTKFTVVTDHYSLKWLFNIKDPMGRIARWALRLQQYDFDIHHRSGKHHLVPDTLSRAFPVVEILDDNLRTVDNTIADKWYTKMTKQVTSFPRQYPLWRLEEGKLYRKIKTRYPDLNDNEWLLVIPREQRKDVIRDNHDPPTSGHLGISKTIARVSQKFYWPKLRADVARYVRHCLTCLRTKPEQRPPVGQMLSSQPTISRPWELVSIDIIGPLPRSTSGFKYIFSVMDCFSKFLLLFPLRNATASSIVKWLEDHVILIFGGPKKVICDNGAQFRSSLFVNLMKKYHIKISYTANYHPQANPVERTHRVIKTMLSSYVGENHKKWDIFLAKIAYAIRSAQHDVTKVTPNFINFGRELRLIVTDGTTMPEEEGQQFNPQERSDALSKLFADVHKRLGEAYERSRKPYNLRHRNETFNLGQKVWKKNYVLSDATKNFTAKLAPKFNGPYKVTRIVSPWSYELSDQSGVSIGIWNAKDIKSHPPEDDK